MAYLLDTDTFIRAKNEHYGFDICPAFWEWLGHKSKLGLVYSIRSVHGELTAGNDDLATWAKNQPSDFYLPITPTITPHLSAVSTWVQSQGFPPAVVAQYFGKADYFIVAQALEMGYAVVTHERYEAMAKFKIKIPNVCTG